MGSVVARLKQQVDEAERETARRREVLEIAERLGEAGIADLLRAVGSPSTNGQRGTKPRRTRSGKPRGREAVRLIVRDRPGLWTLPQLRAEMERRGWFTSAKGLEAAAKRLCDIDKEGRRDGRGRYVFPADHGKEDAIESDVSGAALIASR